MGDKVFAKLESIMGEEEEYILRVNLAITHCSRSLLCQKGVGSIGDFHLVASVPFS